MFQKIIKNHTLLLIVVVFIACILRFYQLGVNPPSLTWDEVAWGYNGYTLGIDGKDEFGKFLPYDALVSFGDYKPPVYAYLTVIPIKLFGLTEFAVRFPSALFGTLSVLITYFLVKELFGRYRPKQNKSQDNGELLALLSAFLLAISPWHIMLSRAAFEANIAAFFIMTGVWLFLFAVHRRPYLMILSVICFIASLYTFNSARVVAPLLLGSLVIGYYKTLWKYKKQTIIAFILGLFLVLPIVNFLVSPEAKLRYAEVNIFADTNIVATANQEVVNDNNTWWSKIIHNRRVAYSREFLSHYFDHFNPQFLFISGDENPKFSTHDVGEMYLWDLPFLVIGVLFLLKKREKNWWILPVLLLIGIIPAALARETPHALRTESTLPTWQIMTAYGFIATISQLKRYKFIFTTIASAVLLFFVMYFLHGYYSHYPKEYSKEWQYGYKDVVSYLEQNQAKYDQINISTAMERGYIYTLFYLKYNPQTFRKEARIRGNDFGFVHIDGFGKYYFADNPETIRTTSKKNLYISSPDKVPPTGNVIKDFYLLNGKKILSAYTI
jgi:4-amino-4-deoxy-L-arabinose transferase-like glycosyltransferase